MLNLDASYYTAASVFTCERERLFTRSWQLLGPASQVAGPGAYVATDIAGIKVFALRGSDGMLRAFRNVCRHRGALLLAEGNGRCESLRCPYHQWLYERDITFPASTRASSPPSASTSSRPLPATGWCA